MNRRTLLAGIVAAPLAPIPCTGTREELAELTLALAADFRRFQREMARAAGPRGYWSRWPRLNGETA